MEMKKKVRVTGVSTQLGESTSAATSIVVGAGRMFVGAYCCLMGMYAAGRTIEKIEDKRSN